MWLSISFSVAFLRLHHKHQAADGRPYRRFTLQAHVSVWVQGVWTVDWVGELGYYGRRLTWRVLMPDHLHLAVSPEPQKDDLSRLLQRFKSFTTRLAWQHGYRGALWQRSYYDHIARGEEDVIALCQYILSNPVRQGLVTDAALWPYSGMPCPQPG